MGYKYKEDSHGWRSCAEVGAVYRVLKSDRHKRIFKDDLFLCLFKTGDCHYCWVHLKERVNNGDFVYYTVGQRISDYCTNFTEAFPRMRRFDNQDLVHILVNKEAIISTINTLTDEERKEVEQLRILASRSLDARQTLIQKYGIQI